MNYKILALVLFILLGNLGYGQIIGKDLQEDRAILERETSVENFVLFLEAHKERGAMVLQTEMPTNFVANFFSRISIDSRESFDAIFKYACYAQDFIPPDSAVALLMKCIPYSKEYFHEKLAEVYFSIGTIQGKSDQNYLSIENLKIAENLAIENQQDTLLLRIYNNISAPLLNVGNHLKALDYLTRFLSLADNLNLESYQATGLINLAEYYRHEGDNENSLANAKKALKIFSTINDSSGVSKMYNNIGIVYSAMGKRDSALYFLNEGLIIAKELNDLYLVPKYLVNLAQVYAETGAYRKAEEHYQQADSIASELGLQIAFYYTNLGRAEMMEYQGKTNEKIFYLERAKNYFSNPQELEALNLKLSKAYAEVGNYKEAYKNLDEGTTLRDSIFKNQSELEIKELVVRYETEKQKAENEQLKTKNITLEATTRLKNFSIIFLILILFFAAVFFAFANHKKKQTELLNESLSSANAIVNEKNEALTALNTINKKLISILSHDMRTPLVNIRGVLDLVRGDLLSKEEQQFVFQQLHADINQTENLLHNMVNWVKIASEKGLVTNIENVLVHQVVDNLISLYASNSKTKKITVFNQLDKNLSLSADEQLIHLILRNLLANALKFSNEGSEIIIKSSEDEKDISIGVQDFGKGIAADKVEKIIDGKSILGKGTNEEIGTGIGLTITKDAISELGGKFWVVSEVGRGSTFWFSLPKTKQ